MKYYNKARVEFINSCVECNHPVIHHSGTLKGCGERNCSCKEYPLKNGKKTELIKEE